MKIEKINFILLSILVLGLVYTTFYQPYQQKQKMKSCFDMAVAFEKARHQPTDDLTVTNQDILSFQKILWTCMSD